ncbi:MAG: NADH-quinone oxidoreductase subunit J [Acidobacteria bacterium]|nr:NADH-quinone oxidoreductase subunit J [Acidobacteriota bacterium]
MGTELLLFYLFGGVAVAASLLVVLGRNAMHSVLLLIVSFAALAALYITLDSPFAAVIQIIIYAGAIMVLFLFVVMLLNAHKEDDYVSAGAPTMKKPLYMGAVLAVVLAAELVWALVRAGHAQDGMLTGGASPDAAALGSVRALGQLLFTDYAFAFEVTSILIIVAMVGAVVLAKREL